MNSTKDALASTQAVSPALISNSGVMVSIVIWQRCGTVWSALLTCEESRFCVTTVLRR